MARCVCFPTSMLPFQGLAGFLRWAQLPWPGWLDPTDLLTFWFNLREDFRLPKWSTFLHPSFPPSLLAFFPSLRLLSFGFLYLFIEGTGYLSNLGTHCILQMSSAKGQIYWILRWLFFKFFLKRFIHSKCNVFPWPKFNNQEINFRELWHFLLCNSSDRSHFRTPCTCAKWYVKTISSFRFHVMDKLWCLNRSFLENNFRHVLTAPSLTSNSYIGMPSYD